MAELQDRILRARQAIHTEWNPSRWEARQRSQSAHSNAAFPLASALTAMGLFALGAALFVRDGAFARSATLPVAVPSPVLLPMDPPAPAARNTSLRPQSALPEPATVPVVSPPHSATSLPREPSFEHSMATVDRLRREGHTTSAIGLLQRLLRDHPRGPSAQTAWFTLGRMHFERADYSAAAQSFARLSPGSPLAEDALAREASAWARAGQRQRARSRAERYLQNHPHGAHVRAMNALLDSTFPAPSEANPSPPERTIPLP